MDEEEFRRQEITRKYKHAIRDLKIAWIEWLIVVICTIFITVIAFAYNECPAFWAAGLLTGNISFFVALVIHKYQKALEIKREYASEGLDVRTA